MGGSVKVRSPRSRVGSQRGASRVDVVVAAALVGLLAGWFGFSRVGERGRVGRCAAKLRVLGQAVSSYADDHHDGIPAAAINLGGLTSTWDEELFPYLKPGLAKASGAYEKRQLLQAVQPLFLCPADALSRGGHSRS